MMQALRKWTIAGVAAATLAGTVAVSTQPAQAFYGPYGYGYGFHRFHGGFGYRPFFGPRFGFYRPFYRRAFFGPRFYGYGPGFYGAGFYRHRFFGPFGYRRFGFGPRRFFY